MNVEGFKTWLHTEYVQRTGKSLGAGTQVSRIANCSTIEQIEGDLDAHFQRDGMRELLDRLTYSTDDAREKKPPRHRIPIDGDIANGTSTYRAAVNLYRKFLIARQAVAPMVEDNAETQEEIADIERSHLTPTEKKALVLSRIGQGVFRHLVLEIWDYRCAVTKAGILLCASHIKPWRLSDNRERLDGFNGLALSPVFDKAFDAGLITFDVTGEVLLSPKLPAFDAEVLGLKAGQRLGGLESEHAKYLEYHQHHIWQSAA
jgi:HNH endonuclease